MARKKATKAQSKKSSSEVSASGKKKTGKTVQRDQPQKTFPIVGLGASAGGMEALKVLFAELPKNSGMAYIVVVHMTPKHSSMMPSLLQKVTPIPVIEAKDGQLIEPDHIYVVPPDKEISIFKGQIQLMDILKEGVVLSIDLFFRSLSQDQGSNAVAIILSGAGTDGRLGIQEIKANDGLVVVQEVKTAGCDGMPRNAISTGLVDMVLPVEEMPKEIGHYFSHPWKKLDPKHIDDAIGDQQEWLNKIFAILRTQVGHDFSVYKINTILRRIERRMGINHIDNHETYVRYLRENPSEVEALFREMLIGVTNFFRDAESFNVLKREVLPKIFEQMEPDSTFRVWVPGCSTGEEVYSLAIILRECLDAYSRQIQIQLFGTDIDNYAIDKAREGLFPASIAVDVSPERLKRFFTREGDYYRIKKEIRDCVVFSVQDVIKDPPFSRLNLLCCRNLLIYLDTKAQKKMLPLFHYTLKLGGVLVLGTSETIGGFSNLFSPLDNKWKIFKRREVPKRLRQAVDFPSGPPTPEPIDKELPGMLTLKRKNIAQLAQKAMLDQVAPTAVLVNAKADILYFQGRTGNYLETPSGLPTYNILDLAREGLRIELSSALRNAKASGEKVTRKRLPVKTNGHMRMIDLHVCPQTSPKELEGNYLVIFEEIDETALASGSDQGPKDKVQLESEKISELEKELKITRESYQTAIEELESSNEELKSTNEELQSSNEELQSTNEELESSKEELQSLNEELQTVNAELQSKVEELSATHDDMHNLLNSTEIATIFVDNDLQVRRFTTEAQKIVNLIHADIGRPLKHVASNLTYTGMIDDLADVLKTLAPKSIEVQTNEGQWYNMRIVPYRTMDNRIDGLVMTFSDIAMQKQAMFKLAKVFMDGADPIIIEDLDGNITEINDEAVRLYGWSREELVGKPILDIIPKERHKKAKDQLERCKNGKSVRNIEGFRCNKKGDVCRVLTTLSLLKDDQDEPFGIATITKHVDGHKEEEG